MSEFSTLPPNETRGKLHSHLSALTVDSVSIDVSSALSRTAAAIDGCAVNGLRSFFRKSNLFFPSPLLIDCDASIQMQQV
jgi:hypothetical protein